MDLEQLSRKIIHIDMVELFKNVKSKEEFYAVKNQLYSLLIEKVVSYGIQYGKCENITFTEKDKDEIYLSVVYGQRQIYDILSMNYRILTIEQVMVINDFVTYGLNYVDKYVHEMIKKLGDNDHIYFNLVIVSNGILSLSCFTQTVAQRR